MIIAARIVNAKIIRQCPVCNQPIVGMTLRLFGMAQHGDKPQVTFMHLQCYYGTRPSGDYGVAKVNKAVEAYKARPKPKKQYTRLVIDLGYVVDPDNYDMVQLARDCFYEDIMSAVKNNELMSWIEEIPAPGCTEQDIPEHIRDEPPEGN